MNKVLFFLLLIITGLVYIFNIDKSLSDKFTIINTFKQNYLEKMLTVSNNIEKYFYQASNIEKLKEENKQLKRFQALYLNSKYNLKELEESTSYSLNENYEVVRSRVISYVNFDDYTKVWLDSAKQDEQIQGLILDDFAAGIVIKKSNKALALLNGNEKANYTVYIGSKKAPGIVHNYKRNYLKIKFVPIWIDINIGDEVITSGMDNIFFEGLKVGKVISINKMADMQEAIIKPYAKVLQEKYFYIYSHNIKLKETTSKDKTIETIKTKEKLKRPNKKP